MASSPYWAPSHHSWVSSPGPGDLPTQIQGQIIQRLRAQNIMLNTVNPKMPIALLENLEIIISIT